MKNVTTKCLSCGNRSHDFGKEEVLDCVPPKDVLKFGQHQINNEYRDALFNEFPFYTAEEILGSYLGYNPHFLSQNAWVEKQESHKEEDLDI